VSDPIEHGRAHFMETLGNIPEPIRAMIDYAPAARLEAESKGGRTAP
jgi:hypothetical protein